MSRTDLPSSSAPSTDGQPELKRVMGPGLLLLFIIGDILGTGIYALTGQVAGEVGGAAWLPFVIAFAVALVTACSYLELVTKYPQAAGAALYVHKAFGKHFLTFLVCFTVMCSGITSASAASRAFAANLVTGFGIDAGNVLVLLIALGFMCLVLLVNLRGVAESLKINVLLTAVELSGLLLVVLISGYFIAGGNADFSRVVAFETASDKGVFLAVSTATSLAFFAMVGFEDSVNMAEETRDPARVFPRVMLTGLGIAGLIYVLVSVCAVAVVPVGRLASSETPLATVVQTAAPDFPIADLLPFISMFAVANSALINMLMASRLLYGMSKQGCCRPLCPRCMPYDALHRWRSCSPPPSPSVSSPSSHSNPTARSWPCWAGRRRCSCSRYSRASTFRFSCCAGTGSTRGTSEQAVCCPWWVRSLVSTWSCPGPPDAPPTSTTSQGSCC